MEIYTATGQLGKDVSEIVSKNGLIYSFSIAIDKSYYSKSGEKVQKTKWLKCIRFSEKEWPIAKYLKKGAKVQVLGEVDLHQYENSNNEKKSELQCKIEKIEMMKFASDSNELPPNAVGTTQDPTNGQNNDSDDLPF